MELRQPESIGEVPQGRTLLVPCPSCATTNRVNVSLVQDRPVRCGKCGHEFSVGLPRNPLGSRWSRASSLWASTRRALANASFSPRAAVMAGLLAAISIAFFPPWTVSLNANGVLVERPLGRAFVFAPPRLQDDPYRHLKSVRIDFQRWTIEEAAIIGLGTAALLLLRRRTVLTNAQWRLPAS